MSFSTPYLMQMALAGRLFIGSTTHAGVTIPAYNATAQTFGLWNPAGSGRVLFPVKLALGQTDATTPAISSIGLSRLETTGATVATGAPISAFTETAPISGLLGAPVGPHAGRFTLAATITAPTFSIELGFSQDSVTPGTQIDTVIHEFSGETGIWPGTYVGLGGAPIAPGQDFAASIWWIEVDQP